MTAGAWFVRTGDQSYIINPAQPDDYRRLIADLQEAGRTPGIVVHLWGLTNASSRWERLDLLVEAERLGFNSLLFLAQALYDQGVSQTLRLMAVTNEMQGVIGDEVLHPERAVVLGPCRVIDQEYAHFSCSSVDIVLPEPGTPAWEKVLEQLSGEIRHGTSDRVVAFRGRHRWVQSYEPVRIEGMGSPSPRLRSGGVYLITGGLGRIGLAAGGVSCRPCEGAAGSCGALGRALVGGVECLDAREPRCRPDRSASWKAEGSGEPGGRVP